VRAAFSYHPSCILIIDAEYTPEQADKFWAERFFETCVEDWPSFVRLLRRMLIIDPEQRPSAEELLRDPYFDGMQDVGV
jgi:serine/threonine protein kinase